ncbi:MAG: hypothetical protein AAF708_18580 [Deinococcota bacterium]
MMQTCSSPLAKTLHCAISIIIASAFCCATGLAQQSYYPTEAGSSWFFDSGERIILETITETTFNTFIADDSITPDQVRVRLRRTGDVISSREVLSFTEDGVFAHGSSAAALQILYDPPLLIYPSAPLDVGQQWQSVTDIQALTFDGQAVDQPLTRVTITSTVLGIQGVETAAGRFNSLLIEQVTQLDVVGADGEAEPVETVRLEYFVPGLGVVAFVEDGREVVLEDTNFYIP